MLHIPNPTFWAEARIHALQFLCALAGGAIFHAFGVPAAWLSGSVVAVAILAAFGRARPLPPLLADGAMLLAGITMGATATPEAFAAIGRYPLSLVLLLASIAVVTLISAWVLRKMAPWSRDEALLASVPGALSAVMAVAADKGARLGPIAVVQMFRLLALVVILPSFVNSIRGSAAIPALPPSMPLLALALMIPVCWLAGMVFERLRLAAPMLLGAMAISMLAHGTGYVVGGLPEPLAILTFILFGIFIGARVRTLNRAQLAATLPAALASFAVGLLVAALFALAASEITGVAFDTALVAFAPGGLEAMTVLALVLGLDPLYVGAHHLARFLAIGFLLPVLFRQKIEPDE